MVFGAEAEIELLKLPPIQLSQNPRARHERIAVRRARIKAKIAAARKGVGSEDGDAPDADKTLLSMSAHSHKSHHHAHGHAHGPHSHQHPGHHHEHQHQHDHQHQHAAHGRQSKGRAVSKDYQPEGQQGQKSSKKQGVAEIEPILTIDEKLVAHVEKSKKLLEQLLLDAETFVTNVKVAAEYRERTRHDRQEDSKKSRLEKLEKEASECEQMFQSVSANWFTSAKGVLPLELYEMIQDQQKSCDDLLEKKQDLIDSLKADIEGNDVEYETDLQKYQKDLMLMGDRIDDQVETMRLAFMNELDLLEEYTCKDREMMMEDNEKEWNELMREYDESEEHTMDAMHGATLERFNTLSDLYTQSREQTRRIKIQMEDDMRTLQLEAEQIKIATILNAEKLEYNLEILRRRENENLRMKSSMKRLILNLQDRFNAKALALQNIVKAAKHENELLIKEIHRLEYLNKDAMRKALHEVATDYRKYMDLWKMNEEETKEKLVRLLGIEKFIYENYLALEVDEIDFSVLEERPLEVQHFLFKQFGVVDSAKTKNIPLKQGLDAGRSLGSFQERKVEEAADDEFNQMKVSNSSLIIEPSNSLQFLPGPAPDPVVQRRLMKHITKVICDQTGFVIEERLGQILGPMVKHEKSLIHIDAVLQALGVTNFSEMQILARYMLRESRVMRGVMSKMGTAVTPDISSMRLSVTGLPANEQDAEELLLKLMEKVAQASRPQLDIETEAEPRNVLVTASSSNISIPRGSEFEEDIPGSARDKLAIIAEQGVFEMADFQLDRSQKRIMIHKLPENMSSDVLTPVSAVSANSLEDIIEQFSSDESLVHILKDVEFTKRKERQQAAEEEGEADEMSVQGFPEVAQSLKDSDSTCNSSSVCSCESIEGEFDGEKQKRKDSVKTTRATVMSWAKEAGKPTEQIFPDGENSEDGFNLQKTREATADPEVESRPVTLTSAGSGGRSQTISIPSLATTSAGSDEFLYIEPNDVLRALAAFCKDYNAKIKIELPTESELIDAKLAKLTFPDDPSVIEYWSRFLILLDPKSQELWDAILKCFEYYSQVLEERNQLVLEVGKIYNENIELGYLLKKNYKGRCEGLNSIQFNQAGLPYCDC